MDAFNQGLNATLVCMAPNKNIKGNVEDKVGFLFSIFSFYFPAFIIYSRQMSLVSYGFFNKIVHNCTFYFGFF